VHLVAFITKKNCIPVTDMRFMVKKRDFTGLLGKNEQKERAETNHLSVTTQNKSFVRNFGYNFLIKERLAEIAQVTGIKNAT